MKKLFLLLLLLSIPLFSQSYKYAWFTDTHIGAKGAGETLKSYIDSLNKLNDISFAIFTGDITENGFYEQISEASEIISKLKVPSYVIPGNHDTKWTEDLMTGFNATFKDKFVFDYNNSRHIGVNSGIVLRGGGGHFTPETLIWLDSIVKNTSSTKEIFFYLHHPLVEDVDNWYLASNILRTKNIKLIFCGHGHSNKSINFNGIPGFMGISSIKKDNNKPAGYNIVENTPDSLFIYSFEDGKKGKVWAKHDKRKAFEIRQIDSSAFIDYNNSKLLFNRNFNESVIAGVTTWRDISYMTTLTGEIYAVNIKGEVVWQNGGYGKISGAPFVANNILTAGTYTGEILNFNASTGDLISSTGINDPITSSIAGIQVEFMGQKSQGVIFGTDIGSVYCYDVNSLTELWSNQSADGMIESKPLVLKDRVIAGAWDGYLYCFDSKSGLLNWKWSENRSLYFSPAAANPVSNGNLVFVPTPDKFVSAVDILLGTTKWRFNNFDAWESIGLSSDSKTLFVKSMKDFFYTVDATTGKQIKKIDLKYGLDTSPVSSIDAGNGRILTATKTGMIYLIDKDKPKPLFYMGQARIINIEKLSNNSFVAVNMDGRIIAFDIN
ncbi:MAG: PQQ-binding-like beta-propeller repeat protein [Ignavibacteriaceae bacterium]|nr:PQQ-binding-like beta-propeller repeat protein [Ignavibacteriaceae bacterium]